MVRITPDSNYGIKRTLPDYPEFHNGRFFIYIFQNPSNAAIQVYELWTAKDVLSHITCWHESFARNVEDLVHEHKPHPLKGRLADLNQHGVDEIKPESLETILGRLKAALSNLQNHILSPRVNLIPYKVGSRD